MQAILLGENFASVREVHAHFKWPTGDYCENLRGIGYAQTRIGKGMKTKLANRNRNQWALTLIELLLIVVIIGVAAILLLPALGKTKPSIRIGCINNVKQVGLAFRIWEGDNGDRYPQALYTNSSGGPLYMDSANMFRYFSAMSNEINNPKVLVCPRDEARHYATNFGPDFDSRKVSYFINLDAKGDSNPSQWLAGDDGLTNAMPNVRGMVDRQFQRTSGLAKSASQRPRKYRFRRWECSTVFKSRIKILGGNKYLENQPPSDAAAMKLNLNSENFGV